MITIYRVICKASGPLYDSAYNGCTQQFLKTRTQQHFVQVKNKRFKKDVPDKDKDKNKHYNPGSNTFASTFCQLIPEKDERGIPVVRADSSKYIKLKIEILWKGNPLSVVKTFHSKKCILCARERLYIIRALRLNPEKTINKNNELFGACHHHTKFHRFGKTDSNKANNNTDESIMDERVLSGPLSTTSNASSIFIPEAPTPKNTLETKGVKKKKKKNQREQGEVKVSTAAALSHSENQSETRVPDTLPLTHPPQVSPLSNRAWRYKQRIKRSLEMFPDLVDDDDPESLVPSGPYPFDELQSQSDSEPAAAWT